MDDVFFRENKQEIIDTCLNSIKEDGYARMGHAFKHVYKSETRKDLAYYRSISSILIRDGKYIREPVLEGVELIDFDVLLNPNYQFNIDVKNTNNSVKETNLNVRRSNRIMWVLTGALVAVSIIGLVKEIVKDKRQARSERLSQMQTKAINNLERTWKSAQMQLHRIADSLKKK